MMAGTGLIHMGGRVFDPVLTRFLSPDPHVQFPYFSQSLNRYSYLLNNPLTATDPTGFFVMKVLRGIMKLFSKIADGIMRLLGPVVRYIRRYGKVLAVVAITAIIGIPLAEAATAATGATGGFINSTNTMYPLI